MQWRVVVLQHMSYESSKQMEKRAVVRMHDVIGSWVLTTASHKCVVIDVRIDDEAVGINGSVKQMDMTSVTRKGLLTNKFEGTAMHEIVT